MNTILKSIIENPEQLIAFCALIVSVASLVVTLVTICQTRRHNRLSVTPICNVYPPDYENWVAVIIENKGVGPMITKSTKFYDSNNEIKKYLIDLMPKLPNGILWSDFTKSDHFIVPSDGQKVLLELKGDAQELAFREARDLIRSRLSEITVEYTYTDIYGQKFPTHVYELTYFSRAKK